MKRALVFAFVFFIFKILMLFFIVKYKNDSIEIKSKVIICGDSHMERGWKTNELEFSIAKSAEPLIFTIAKLKLINLRGKEIVVGVSNLTLNQMNLFDSKYFLSRHFFSLTINEHLNYLLVSPKSWLSVFFELGSSINTDPLKNSGFAPLKVCDTLKKATNKLVKIDKLQLTSDINLMALEKFIKENDSLKITLVRMPMFIKEEFQLINDEILSSFVEKITSRYMNVNYIDFHKKIRLDSSNYYDWDHFNAKGADTFFNIRRKFIN
jgi:hypothetical protein